MYTLLNKVQTDLLKRHIGPFFFCFVSVMFLLLMQFLILYIDNLIGKGLPLSIIIELIITNLAHMVVLAAPMAVLVASLMAFGQFSEHNELTALRAAGVNPIQVLKPVLVTGGLMCLFLIWFSNDVLPDANYKARSLFIDIRMKKPGFDLKPNQFYEGIEGYTFLVKRIDSETDSLYDVTLFQERTKQRNKAYIKAEKGVLKSEQDQQTLTMYLYEGSILRYIYLTESREELLEETEFDRYRMSFDLSEMAFSRSNPDQHSRNDRTMGSRAMLAVVDSLRNEIRREKEKTYSKFPMLKAFPDTTQLRSSVSLNYLSRGFNATTDTPPINSNYLAINMIDNLRHQIGLQELALTKLRKYKSAIENLKVNLDWRESRVAKYLVEVHKKFSIPFACIIFVLIGAPIGMFTRKGNLGYAALYSTGFLTFYWISIIQGEKLADRLYISPATGMWASNILLAIAGIYMLIRLTTSFKFSNLWKRSA